jgi:glycosyltransferase involved in cell wall biosynthesis
MRILFLSRWFPFPANNGSKIRVQNLLRTLAERHRVTLLSFRNPEEREGAAADVPFESVRTVVWRPFVPGSARALLGFLRPEPRSFAATYSAEMAELIRNAVAAGEPDLILASEIQMAAYWECFGDVPAIWEEVETGVFLQQMAEASTWLARLRRRLTWQKHCRFVRRLAGRFARCTVVSEPEREILAAIVPECPPIDVVPNALPLSRYAGFQTGIEPATLVFAGALSFEPNWEGVSWFLEKVLPLVHAAVPEAHFTIFGDPGGHVLPGRRNVLMAGEVADVRPYVANATISVVPILRGGGTRLKILESMALGTAVVSTSKGCEGLAVENGRELLVADTPGAFAAAVVSLLRDPEYRGRLAANAASCVAANYDWNLLQSRYLHLVELAALSRSPSATRAGAAVQAG